MFKSIGLVNVTVLGRKAPHRNCVLVLALFCLRLKPLHCGFTHLGCFFFFWSLSHGRGLGGEEAMMRSLLVKCWCHVDSWHLQPLVASMLSAEPCTEDASVSA